MPDLRRASSCSSCSATGAASCRPSAGRVPARTHQRRQRHDRPGPRGLLHVPGRGLPRAWACSGYLGKFFRSTSSRTARRRHHRPVRGLDRVHAGVRQADHAVDATLRQHLRRRGGARRHHRADRRDHPGRAARPRSHAQLHPGAHLQRPDADVHPHRHREPPRTRRARSAEEAHRRRSRVTSRNRRALTDRPPVTQAHTSARPTRLGPNEEEIAHMEHIGAGLAAIGVIGPGIGIGILAGLAAAAIGRNPDAAGQIRGLAIILAGVRRRPRRAGHRRRPADDLHQVAGGASAAVNLCHRPARIRRTRAGLAAEATENTGLPINMFWILVCGRRHVRRVPGHRLAGLAFKPVAASSATRRARIEQGLEDADQARVTASRPRTERQRRPRPRLAARRTRSWRVPRRSPRRPASATSPRPGPSSSGCASRPSAEIEAESQRALADVRAQVADLALAAAGKVVGETMNDAARAPPRRGVPRRDVDGPGRQLMQRAHLMAASRVERAALRRGRLPDRRARRHARAVAARPRRPRPVLATTAAVRLLWRTPAAARRARGGRRRARHADLRQGAQPRAAAAPARRARLLAAGGAALRAPATSARRASSRAVVTSARRSTRPSVDASRPPAPD